MQGQLQIPDHITFRNVWRNNNNPFFINHLPSCYQVNVPFTTQPLCPWQSPPLQTSPWTWFPCANAQTPVMVLHHICWWWTGTGSAKILAKNTLAGKLAPSSTASTMPATNAAQLRLPLSWKEGYEHHDVWRGKNLGDRDECINDGLLLNDVVGSLVIVGVL